MGDRYVVTSATCMNGVDASDYRVRIGDTSLDEEFEATSFTVKVASIKQHPNFDSETSQNDIAILELAESVSLTDYPNIKPICLPEAGALFEGEAIMSGWGQCQYILHHPPHAVTHRYHSFSFMLIFYKKITIFFNRLQ